MESQLVFFFVKNKLRASLVVQQLRLCISNAEHEVQSLVGELRSHMPYGTTKIKNIYI